MANMGCALCFHLYDGGTGTCSITNKTSDELTKVCNQRVGIIEVALRYETLLKSIIDNISTGEDDVTVIKYLLYVGFTKDELIKRFGYDNDTVINASQEMDDYEDNLIFV